jgi:hypothetical protein
MESISNSKTHVILIFLDGIGIGDANPDINPCCHSETGIFFPDSKQLPSEGQKFSLDARLGTPGLPQSATGQTSIYTGINAAKHIGKHLFGFPNKSLRDLLKKNSLFIALTSQGYCCKFLNAFRPIFFTTPELFVSMGMSATTEMNRAADLQFSDFNDLKEGKALYHDYSNESLTDKGFAIKHNTAEDAAMIIATSSLRCDLLLYEYFLTDYAGHSRDMKIAVQEIHKVERLIHALLQIISLKDTTLIVISDHGNIEDIRIKSHTMNPAYMALWSTDNGNTFDSILDIYPFLIRLIMKNRKKS